MAEQPYFRKVKFFDLVNGREGIFVDKVPVSSNRQGIKQAYQVRWVPDVDALKSLISVGKMITGADVVKQTETKYPAKTGLIERKNPCDAEGSHDAEVVAVQDVDGKSKWLNSLDVEIEAKGVEMERRAGDAESKQAAEAAANYGSQGQKRVAESREAPRRRNRGKKKRRRDDDDDDKKRGRKKSRRGGN